MSQGSLSFRAGSGWGSANITKLLMALFLAFAGLLGVLQMSAPIASAQEEPDALGYASEVVSFTPGEYLWGPNCTANPPIPNNQDETATGALGAPDYGSGNSRDTITSLGNGGVLVVKMETPFAGSGDSEPDLFIWEVGEGEGYKVEVSPDGVAWTYVGEVPERSPGMQGFDVDAHEFDEYDQLLYVKITDLAHIDHSCNPGSPYSVTGADIDAVAVLSRPVYADLEIEKTSDVTAESELVAGNEVTYTFTVTNTGTVDLTGVTVTDEMEGLSDIDPASADIAVGDSADFTATYELTQNDLDAGEIQNSASVTGNPPEECTQCETPGDEDELITTIPQDPALVIVKTSDPVEGPVALGDIITYTFEVENTGNVTLTDVTVNDDLEGLSDIDPASIATLAPGDSETFTATYEVSEADVVAGEVVNSATSTGTPPESCVDCDPTSPPDEVIIITEDPEPGLTLTKEADTGGPVAVGDTITYTFVASNTGNVTLDPVVITDDLPGLQWVAGPDLGAIAPGDGATGMATYTVTEADLVTGNVENSATGTGTPPESCVDCDPVTSMPPTVTVETEDPNPALSVLKTADTEGPLVPGETITYTITATNTGNVTLTDVTITDELPGISDIEPATATLVPGESIDFTATYEVTQDDVDTGNVTNTATGTGTPPGDLPPPESPPSTVTIPPEDPTAELTIVKEADTAGPVALGEPITYTFTVENVGNVTISGVTIADDLDGLNWVNGPELGTLRPGDVATGTATYITTEADLLAGGVTNSAFATGIPPAICEDCDPTSPPDEITVPGEDPDPALTVLKEADTAGPVAVGDTITYRFTATNTGNVTLDDVTVTDALPGLTWVEGPTLGTLAPGESATGSATYVVTEADLLNGGVTNSATGTGTPPGELPPPTSPPSTITVPPVDPVADLTLTKVPDTTGPVSAGDTITYTFVATNTGNLTLDPVVITDELPGLQWVTGPNLGALAPGEGATGTATYIVTEADIVNGGVTNVATGTGTPPEGYVGEPPSSTPPPVEIPADDPVPGLAFVKTADTDGPVGSGETITYTFTATNTGNVTLADVVITDQLPGIEWVTGPNLGALAPGETAQGTATYLVTEADVLAGGVTNSATGTGTPPGELPPPTSPPSMVTVETDDPASGLVLVKSAEAVEGAQVGDTITYTFTATNTGNVTLTGVMVIDPLPGLSAIEPAAVETLAPGASATFTASYVVTQADVNAGGVANSATASGTDPDGGTTISPPGEVFVPTEQGTLGLVLDKTVTPDTTVEEGDEVTYTFVVTNIGNTTVTDIMISDPLPGLSDIDGPHGTSLDPGETATFTATYVVTEADTVLGILSNTALVSATGPDGEGLEAIDTARVRACMEPQPTPEPTDEVDEDAAGTPEPIDDVDDADGTDGTDPDAVPGDDEDASDPALDDGDAVTDPAETGDDDATPGDETTDPVTDGDDAAVPGDEPGEGDGDAVAGDDVATDPVDAPVEGDEGDEVQSYLGARSPLGRVLLQATDADLMDCVPLDPDPVTPPPAPQQPAPPPAAPQQPGGQAPGGGSPVTALPTTGQTGPAMSQATLLVGGLAVLAVTAIGLGLVSRGTIRIRQR